MMSVMITISPSFIWIGFRVVLTNPLAESEEA